MRNMLRGSDPVLRRAYLELADGSVWPQETQVQIPAIAELPIDWSMIVNRKGEQQQIVGDRLVDRDVFGLARDGGEVELQVLHVRDGRVMGGADYDFSGVRLDDGDVMGSFLGLVFMAPVLTIGALRIDTLKRGAVVGFLIGLVSIVACSYVIINYDMIMTTLPMATTLYLTEVDIECEGDAYFPNINFEEWDEVESEQHAANEKNPYAYRFITLKRKVE